MKKDEVKVGGVYVAKVSDRLVKVRIDSPHGRGGWNATNTRTGRRVRIKSARRLRGPSGTQAAAPKAGGTQVSGSSAAGTKTGGVKAGRTRASKPKRDAAEDAAGSTVAGAAGRDAKVAKRRAKKATRAKRGGDGAQRMGALDAAAEVLRKSGTPMRSRELIAAMAEQGLWKSPAGKTPHATLYAAILREIAAKGDQARFRKVDRGLFAPAGSGAGRP